MKKLIIEVKDDTSTTVVAPIEIHHLSDLAQGVKEVVDDFIEANDGAVLPPVEIKATEQKDA